jgi:hypothetical protein
MLLAVGIADDQTAISNKCNGLVMFHVKHCEPLITIECPHRPTNRYVLGGARSLAWSKDQRERERSYLLD